MSDPKELMAKFDAGIAQAQYALNALRDVSLEDQEFLDLYDKLKDRQGLAASFATTIEGLAFAVGAARHHKWSTQERYYVYISNRYGKDEEPSIHALREASGSSWHNLPYAASHWQTMEKYRDRPDRKGKPIYYSIMAYDPQTGKLRKVEQAAIDKALEEKK